MARGSCSESQTPGPVPAKEGAPEVACAGPVELASVPTSSPHVRERAQSPGLNRPNPSVLCQVALVEPENVWWNDLSGTVWREVPCLGGLAIGCRCRALG